MIRALAFAAIVYGATWLSHLYDQLMNRNERNTPDE